MNTGWSQYVQGVDTLYLSRALRFSDDHRPAYMRAFNLDASRPLRILELGCGPGALTQALARWYPLAEVTGVDLDSAFIEFARRQAPELRFMEADATALPFADGEFDVTISNTVQEHIAPDAFFGEQRRVLRPGGVCLVLSARRGVNLEAECEAELDEFERGIWARVRQRFEQKRGELGVGRYAMSERELPLAMQARGFEQVSTEYLTINLTPDNPGTPPPAAHAMIEAKRCERLDALSSLGRVADGQVSAAELDELRSRIDRAYAQRRSLYDAGQPQWDANVSLTMVLRGVKR